MIKLKERIHLAFGEFLAGFLDLCAGIFIVHILGIIFNKASISAADYFLGAILAVLPDIDLAYLFLKKGKVEGNHHEIITHRPLIMVPLLAGAGMLFGGAFWAITAPACLLWHYLHDTEGFGGGGVGWLWPLSKKYYSPFGNCEPHESLSGSGGSFHAWIKDTWLRPNKQSAIELALGLIFLILVLLIK